MNRQQDCQRLAEGWIDAWVRMDMKWLRESLDPDFVHHSPFGRLEGREHYLDTVEPLARKSVVKLQVRQIVARDDQAAIWFENHTPNGVVPTCDWIRAERGAIKEIHSFYDSSPVCQTLTPEEQASLDASKLGPSVVPALLVRDMSRTLSFYSALGFQVTGAHPDSFHPVWAEVSRGNSVLQFHTQAPHGTPPEPVCSGTIYFYSEDLHALASEFEAHVAFAWGPEFMEYGRREFGIQDPDGYFLGFAERN